MLEHSTTFPTEKFSVTTIYSPYTLLIFTMSLNIFRFGGLFVCFKNSLLIFKERGKERESETSISCLQHKTNQGQSLNPGMLPDLESNRQLFSAQDKAQQTKPHQPESIQGFKTSINSLNKPFNFDFYRIPFMIILRKIIILSELDECSLLMASISLYPSPVVFSIY